MNHPIRTSTSLFIGLLLAAGLVCDSMSPGSLAAQDDAARFDLGVRYQPTAMPDRIVLTWTGDPATSQAVTWRTDISDRPPVVEYTIADDGPSLEENATRVNATTQILESNRSTAAYHSATLNELTPETTYAYRVGDGVNWSSWSHFQTASAEAKPFTFIYFGDAQNDIRSRWARVIREAFKEAPRADFLLHAGDLVNDPRRDEEWGEWFESGGWIFSTMSSIATPGNHEYMTYRDGLSRGRRLTDHWKHVFSFPTNGPESLQTSTYFLDYQGARIVSLNSNQDHELQAEWLDEVLADNPHRWTIVTMHHPVYSSTPERDNPSLREALQPIFDKYQVDLVLQGHDHTYSRTELVTGEENVDEGLTARVGKGTLYVVSVSGPKMYNIGERDFMRRVAEDTQLFQVIHVDADRLKYEARTATGRLYDAFELVKREGDSNELIEIEPEMESRRRN